MARINLPKFIAEHYRAGITARDVVREALTNAIHAGGTNIFVNLHFSTEQQSFLGDDRNYLDKIEIVDDGEGFTEKNLEYFDEICTSHKDSIGGKGIGRLSFLKYGNDVTISSQLPTELVQFPYTPHFSLGDVRRLPNLGAPKTSVSISDPKEKVYTQVTNLINTICDDLRLLLFLKKRSGQLISIEFSHNSTQPFPKMFTFSAEDIEPLVERPFEIEGETFNCYLFSEPAPRKGIVAMLCADDICVEELVVSKRFDVCRYILSVTSPYLDRRSNLERQRIELPKAEDGPDLVSPITRDALVRKVHDHCVELVNEVGKGEIEAFKSDNIAKLTRYYPFIDITSLHGSAAFLDADEIVRDYRAQQARREDKIVNELERGGSVSWDDVSHLASEDLARYIVHRALVIDSLAKMPPGTAEDAIHDAILPKKSDGSDIRTNNVWIVDDKFLAYSNVFSDETLSHIIERVNEKMEAKLGRKPDVAAFFTSDDHDNPNKLVIIEFKKPGADLFANTKALTQCRLYASELAENIPTVREVFSFSVVDIDDEFYRDLKQTGFKDVFSLTERVVYNDFAIGRDDDIPLHLYVMPAAALIKDAKARNRIFEEVLQFDSTRTSV
jgi:hypothetical protein